MTYIPFPETLRGLEKENLRVTINGMIAPTNHPKALGHPLTHPKITTDFAEGQVEVVTTPDTSIQTVFAELEQIYSFVQQNLNQELLWPNSMPPMIWDCQQIPLANYGNSQQAQIKMTYRRALCYRYRRVMQIISGIHYNFSMSKNWFASLHAKEVSTLSLADFINQKYFSLIRNYFRHAWILPYLFGASPICATSSVTKEVDYIQPYDETSYFAPFGTSLRLSDLGYQNKGQHLLNISFNSIDEYTNSLLQATELPYPEFTALGLYDAQGQRKQLNDHLLQIENEYYSPIRPKQIMQQNERPIEALRNRGVEYVEVRILDINPLLPYGLSQHDAAFIELFLLYCISQPSLMLSHTEHQTALRRIHLVATQGRDPALSLSFNDKEVKFQHAATELLEDIQQFCSNLTLPELYQEALFKQFEKINDVSLIPSQQIMQYMQQHKLNFMDFNLELARQHKEHYLQNELLDAKKWRQLAETSMQEFLTLEQKSK